MGGEAGGFLWKSSVFMTLMLYTQWLVLLFCGPGCYNSHPNIKWNTERGKRQKEGEKNKGKEGLGEKKKKGMDRTYSVWVRSGPDLILIAIWSRWVLSLHFADVVMEVHKS